MREFWMLKAAGSAVPPSLYRLWCPSSSTNRCTKEHSLWTTGNFIASLWKLFTNQISLVFSMWTLQWSQLGIAQLGGTCIRMFHSRISPMTFHFFQPCVFTNVFFTHALFHSCVFVPLVFAPAVAKPSLNPRASWCGNCMLRLTGDEVSHVINVEWIWLCRPWSHHRAKLHVHLCR